MNKSIFKDHWESFLFISIFLLVFFSSINLVSAVPPVTTTQQFIEGYEIRIPQDNIIEMHKTYDFEFHVFNISTGLPKTSGVSCYFHLYNETGNHVYEAMVNTVTHDFDYGFKVDAGNFTRPAHFYYNIQCNSSTLGGDHSSLIEITKGNLTGSSGSFGFFAIILALSLGLIILGLAIKDPTTTLLGSFGLYFIGLYILLYGILEVKDLVTTYAIGLIILMFAAYVSIRSAYELITSAE
jgi:hypothetical protein